MVVLLGSDDAEYDLYVWVEGRHALGVEVVLSVENGAVKAALQQLQRRSQSWAPPVLVRRRLTYPLPCNSGHH